MRWTVCRCGFYIYWIKHTAGYITGFPYHTLLDVNPLIQLPVYLALPVVGLALLQRRRRAAWPRIGGAAPWQAILFVAIALQAGNYFYSSLARGSLDGGLLDWASAVPATALRPQPYPQLAWAQQAVLKLF